MDLFAKLGNDMARLWEAYGSAYLDGIRSTLILAVVATVIGCIIGLICGILNTIPYTKNDPLPKRFVLKLIRVLVRIYVEVFRGTPMVLQAVFIYYGLPYFSNNTMRFDVFGWQLSSLSPSTQAPIWRKPSGAALSPWTWPDRRGQGPSA